MSDEQILWDDPRFEIVRARLEHALFCWELFADRDPVARSKYVTRILLNRYGMGPPVPRFATAASEAEQHVAEDTSPTESDSCSPLPQEPATSQLPSEPAS